MSGEVERMVVEALVPGCASIGGPTSSEGMSRVEVSGALTLHCRKIPSWLVCQYGHRQVD